MNWLDRLFERLPQEGFWHHCIVIPLWLLFIVIHFSMSFLAILGGINYEYYHGPRIKWRRK